MTLYIPVWLAYVALAIIVGPVVWFLFEVSMAVFGNMAAKYVMDRLIVWDMLKGYKMFVSQMRRDGKLPRSLTFRWRGTTEEVQFPVAKKPEVEDDSF